MNYHDFDINTGVYDWAVRTFQSYQSMLGLNLKVHGNTADQLERGQIFLFNHFARFETVIPPYILHVETNSYSRSVADHHLFGVNEKFSKLLRGVGAVPNNLPGLLPFLAAEILRGRKVVIFPEGGMIKDRRVLDDKGQFRIFSPTKQEFRKHHRGAAVLALTLEIFKRRILDNFEQGNERRIAHWQKSLGLATPEELLEQAKKPTLIVPGNITFYPIRIDDNLLTRGMQWFTEKPSLQALEEMAVEGNLLLRDTDMDVRLSDPIAPNLDWSWWQRALLNKYFADIHSLDDFFGLRENANKWTERLLVTAISRETERLRDAYMSGLYKGITVNLAHLASALILRLVKQGRMEVDFPTFQRTLYRTLKLLHNSPHVHLHRSLNWPDKYRGLPDGDCPELERFLDTCAKAGLLVRGTDSYRFSDRLLEKHDFKTIRMENPLLVSANEVAPVSAVAKALTEALATITTVSAADMAHMLFDDEVKSYAWNRQHYGKKKYAEINGKETATENGQPFFLLPKTPKKRGVLLVHGLLASPAEMRGFGDELHAAGHAVLGVRLAGHGTSPWDLHTRTWQDWLASVRRGYRILSTFVDEVVVVGFSTGGALSMLLATEQPDKLAGVVSVATPLAVKDKNLAFVPLVHRLNRAASWLPSLSEGIIPFYMNDPEHPHINYRSMPLSALNELRTMMGVLRQNLPRVHTPTLLIQGDNDPVVEPESITQLVAGLAARDKHLHWVRADVHGLIYDTVGDTRTAIRAFLDGTPYDWRSERPPAPKTETKTKKQKQQTAAADPQPAEIE
jgi:esterase/lipase/1-acyl-sn-glycerol-3-phosphate acyltransferase